MRTPRQALHFLNLRHEQRVLWVDRIARSRLRTVAVLVHKPSIGEPTMFQRKQVLYFSAARYLLERVSWLCRDYREPDDPGDGCANVLFSNRANMSYDEFRRYIADLQSSSDAVGLGPTIRPDRISTRQHADKAGLQMADAVAGSFFRAVQPGRLGFTEDRYARMLSRVVYRRNGNALRYGVKVWPDEAEAHLLNGPNGEWLRGLDAKTTAGPGDPGTHP